MKNAMLNPPISSYGIKGAKHLQKISEKVYEEIKIPRNEKNEFFRPFTAEPQKEKILLNKHLLRTQDFKEILNEKHINFNENFNINDKFTNESLLEDINISKTKNYKKESVDDNSRNTEIQRNNEKIEEFSKNINSFPYFVTGIDLKEGVVVRNFPQRPISAKLIKKRLFSGKNIIKSDYLLHFYQN